MESSSYEYNIAKLEELEKYSEANTTFPNMYFVNGSNPLWTIKDDPTILQFKQTKESFLNVEVLKSFLTNAISNFRSTRTYKNYKGFLMGLGLDRCQLLGNITNDMATVEMHHNMLTIFDIAFIITTHITNTTSEGITTMDLCYLLKKVHKEHKVQLVMLSLTPHQLYHNTDQLKLPPEMCFGDWYSFLKEYKYGITKDIAYKLIFYLKEFQEHNFSPNYDILAIRKEIYDWSNITDSINTSNCPSGPYDPIISNMYPNYYGEHNLFEGE